MFRPAREGKRLVVEDPEAGVCQQFCDFFVDSHEAHDYAEHGSNSLISQSRNELRTRFSDRCSFGAVAREMVDRGRDCVEQPPPIALQSAQVLGLVSNVARFVVQGVYDAPI